MAPHFSKTNNWFQRVQNLKDSLTKATISFPPVDVVKKLPTQVICTRLGKCKYCPMIKYHKNVTCSYTKQTFTCNSVPKRITCELDNVIHMIKCKKCNKYYIGETGRPLRKRIYEHIYSVKNHKDNKSTPVSEHFTQMNRSHSHMQFSLIEWCTMKNPFPDMTYRRTRQAYWIWNLHSLTLSTRHQHICLIYLYFPSTTLIDNLLYLSLTEIYV